MKKILLIIAFEGFQPVEYSEPKRVLESGGVEVVTASNKKGKAISAYTNLEVNIDLSLDEIVVEDYDGLFLIGGPFAMGNLDSEEVYKIMSDVKENGLLWGAICISPRILANANLLKDKKVTGWNGDEDLQEILEGVGAKYIEKGVVVDGKLITADGPSSAEEFGEKILENL